MKNFNTKEIVVDVVMEVLVTQRFEVPIDYHFDDEDYFLAYRKLINDFGTEVPNLTEQIEFEDIDAYNVLEVNYQVIADVNID